MLGTVIATDGRNVTVRVEGLFVKNGRGPLGQSAARYPFKVGRSERDLTLTHFEHVHLTKCSLCGRLTANPGFHWNRPRTLVLPHCEVCGSHTDDAGNIKGWYPGPYEAVR